jgi:hypothetical protein
MINTKSVKGRRSLRFEQLADILSDAEEIASGEIIPLGNWTAGQVFSHCAQTMNCFLDGHDFGKVSFLGRFVGWLIKGRMLSGEMPAGFKAPDPVLFPPAEVSVAEGLAALKSAIARWQRSTLPPSHPFFGTMSREDWNNLHLRHCELHFSFLTRK